MNILNSSSDGDLFLTLTQERGFGVYSYTIKVRLSDTQNKKQTEKEIEDFRSMYIENPDDFSKNHTEIILESIETKKALEQWISKK